MGLLDRFTKKQEEKQAEIQQKEEEFIQLIRVYLQAAIAAEPKLGLTNVKYLPDLMLFKRTLKVPTQGRLGMGERTAAKKLLKSQYGLSDTFFEGLDKSVRKTCHKQNDVQSFFFMFQQFSNDLISALSSHLQWKLRIPSFFRKMIHTVIEDGVKDLMTKNDWTAADLFQAVQRLRKNADKLGYNQKFMVDYAYPILMIAKGSKAK